MRSSLLLGALLLTLTACATDNTLTGSVLQEDNCDITASIHSENACETRGLSNEVVRENGPFLMEDANAAVVGDEANVPNVVVRRWGPFKTAEGLLAAIPTRETAQVHAAAPEEREIPILVYHHVRKQEGWAKSTWSWKMTVSPDVFDTQMQWLVDHGYTTITLDTLTAILRGEILGPVKPVVVTFDDNNTNVLDTAVASMVSRGQIGVFYLVANRLENTAFMNKEQIQDLISKGMDIQSHTMTHAGLTNLSNAQAEWQLAESKRILEELTGKPVRHIAYPLTMHNQRIRDLARDAGYVTGTIMDPRPMRSTDDWMKLPRIMMTDDTNLANVLP